MKTPIKPQESIADFKQRIALLMRNREGGRVYSMIGAARPDPCVVRSTEAHADRMFYETKVDNPKQHGILSHDKEKLYSTR